MTHEHRFSGDYDGMNITCVECDISPESVLADLEHDLNILRLGYAKLRTAALNARDVGFNEDCMFCGFKDKELQKGLGAS